jgi:DNA polymerase V
MAVLDHINRKHGKGTLKMAAEALSRAWEPRKGLSSPRYTSDWSALPEVKLL